ncbi:PREDICTED: protein RIK isoform X2 [Tarenaya hassleriana]|uniref:protein RIK isoform X2 n=1 Tax=Tarenaya hassleriana TaxID=28532 RepID=UPI00053CA6BD|nr:PREDICTED: protein RIK isoform X2 [Tarenaya hassleriana]
MTEDRDGARVSPTDSMAAPSDTSQTRHRKKRKWDQPSEQLVSAGVAALPGLLPLGNMGVVGSCVSPSVPAITSLNTVAAAAAIATVAPLFQTLSSPQQTAAVAKLNQPKHEELTIAREIVINDAEASIRHKLTKRQTQEEIQKSTGAVVITRGKYRLPNAPSDGEKPLYLHISAASHLKETAERILAVDRAAAMVEEMMKQNSNSQAGLIGSQMVKPLSTCVYLGFEADPSCNVAARIRGPNDQYINHIMNETGASVVLRGCGSGHHESQHGEEAQQPLHLLLSSCNPKSLEEAKRLAENLLDTISIEFGASRISSNKVYGAVPPPQQLLSGSQGSENEKTPSLNSTCGLMSLLPGITMPSPVSAFSATPATTLYPQGGTSYSGYAGIYPQATPLQQVAQVLKQSISPVTSIVPPIASTSMTVSKPSDSSCKEKEKERHLPPKRKFQELPAGCKVPAKANQYSEPVKSGDPVPKNTVQPSANGMPPPKSMMMPPPPPPKTMPPRSSTPSSRSMPPPPPPKFTQPSPLSRSLEPTTVAPKEKSDPIPDTLVKLMEYGDDDEEEEDDTDETRAGSSRGDSNGGAVRKPFWAV